MYMVNVYLIQNKELQKYPNKRYSIIDQQIARHFVHYTECLYHHPSLLYNSYNSHFLASRISANYDKGLEF